MVPFVMAPVRKKYILPGNACILFFQRAYKISSVQYVTLPLILASKLQHCEASRRGFGRQEFLCFVMVQLEHGIQLLCLGQFVNLQLWFLLSTISFLSWSKGAKKANILYLFHTWRSIMKQFENYFHLIDIWYPIHKRTQKRLQESIKFVYRFCFRALLQLDVYCTTHCLVWGRISFQFLVLTTM